MAAAIPFIPLIAAGVGVGGSLISGAQADSRNNQQIGLAQQSQQKHSQ